MCIIIYECTMNIMIHQQYNVQYRMSSVHCILHIVTISVYYTLYSVQISLHNVDNVVDNEWDAHL